MMLLMLIVIVLLQYNGRALYVRMASVQSSSKGVRLQQQQPQQQQKQEPQTTKGNTLASTVMKKEYEDLIIDPIKSRIMVKGQRYIVPGDYVVHEQYGIGLYLGLRSIDITPARSTRLYSDAAVIKYSDGEITWFKRMVDEDLWLYREQESGIQELSSLLNNRKWKKRKENAENSSQNIALNLLRMTAIRNDYHRTPCAPLNEKYKQFESLFKFEPTIDQLKCFREIENDMIKVTRPMDRLICGDVGFGKTEVAMRAIYISVLSNRQVAFLAPTRILALQHLRVLRNRMPNIDIRLLRGGNNQDNKDTKAAIADGTCQIVVGTHALLQPNIVFLNLGLIIIDEEQRFGVAQKEKLKVSQSGIDILTLSATPIPRTLQMSLSGLKEFSQMTSPPKGRKEVIVCVGKTDDKKVMIDAIRNELMRDGQVFFVVPFISEVGKTSAMIRTMMEDVTDVSISIIEAHGGHTNLEDRIDAFTNRQGNVLVATTVIENGIDMPNVNTIVVLNADRFGMSQLHQLKGRVGRGPTQAYAYFMTGRNNITIEAETRLMYLKTFTSLGSGYDLSRRDMEMRGHGSIFGSEQSGSKDVGLDFQAHILKQAIEKISQDYILSCSETYINLNTSIEVFGTIAHGPIPTEMNMISIWEESLARSVISRVVDKSYVNRSNEIDIIVKKYAATGTIASMSVLNTELKGNKYITEDKWYILDELLKRGLLRICCRSMGITSVKRDVNRRMDVVLTATNMTISKWDRIIADSIPSDEKITFHVQSEVLEPVKYPHQQQQHVIIDGSNSTNTNTTDVGIITLKNVFNSQQSDSGNMPQEILELLVPISKIVHRSLINAIDTSAPAPATTVKKLGKK